MAIRKSVLPDGTTLLQIGTAAGEQISGNQVFDGIFYADDEIRGGDGADSLSGQTGQNDLFGQGGDDFISLGGGGNTFDRGFGGKDDDSFTISGAPGSATRLHLANGGSGSDTAILSFLPDRLIVANETVSFAGANIARLRGIETIIGSNASDKIALTGSIRQVSGGEDFDTLDATKADKFTWLFGGAGDDILRAGVEGSEMIDGDELRPGQTGTPRFYGDSDVLQGGKGQDTLISISGDDLMRGRDGGDVFFSIGGADQVFGGGGADTFRFQLENAASYPSPLAVARAQAGLADIKVDGGSGQDTVDFAGTYTGSANLDVFLKRGVKIDLGAGIGTELGTGKNGQFTVRNVEHVDGSVRDDILLGSQVSNRLGGWFGDDTLKGQAGNDTLNGGRGNDKLIGGAGDDFLRGGSGRDVYTGGRGADRFDFSNGDGRRPDKVKDFRQTDGDQLILFYTLTGNAKSFAELSITNTANGALVDYGGGSILVEGVNGLDLKESDFGFFFGG